MTRYSFFTLCLFLGLLSASAAVPETASGIIIDAESRQPVGGAVVQALNARGKAVAFASSNANGVFKIKVSDSADSISFRCMGYETLKLPRSYDFAKGVELWPKVTQLKDVVVHAPDIYAKGDTLVFNVERYANAKDNAIIDVIKRLPGIKVEDDGTIKYQGKPINKFYIDGNDFVGGQYGLATNNISHEDVKSVEVMENHQPVKALEGIEFPEEAGINLKLKDNARSRWVGVAKAGGGAEPALGDGSLYAMRIAPKLQNIVTLRAGNTPWNPASQITEHDFYDMFSGDYAETLWPEYISADVVSPPLTEKRTRDNLSWIANMISAWNRGDNSMRLKLNYTGDRLDYNSALNTNYFSPSIPDFMQHNSLRTQTHNLSAQFSSEINKRGYYLKDKLTANAVWDSSNSAITGSMNLGQNVKRRDIDVNNDLKLVKRNDKRLFELVARNSFRHSPNRLSVTGEEGAVQSLGITDFRSTTETQFGRLTRFCRFYVSGGIDLNYHRMNAVLEGMERFDNSGIHTAFLSDVHATPQVDYERGNWRLSMTMAAKWLHHSLNGHHDYLNLSPTLSVRKKISAKSEVSGKVGYKLSSPPAYLNVPVPVLADYRNLFVGESNEKYAGEVSAGVSYRYRNPLKAFFFNVAASYSHSRSWLMSNQLFVDNLIVATYADRVAESDTWNFSGGVSKGLGHSKMIVGCDFSASTSSGASMRDNAVNPFRSIVAKVEPYFKGSILRWLSVNYRADYSLSRLEVNEVANTTQSLAQTLSATFVPHDRVLLTIGAEHFLTHFPEGNTANLVLLDASAVWKVNPKLRLSLEGNNLLNRRRYEYITYGTLSRTAYSCQIRPRTLLATLQYRF